MYNLINKIGHEHSIYGTTCQDYGYVFTLENGDHKMHCAVVCDGCGSVPLSVIGATLFPRILETNCANMPYEVRPISTADGILYDTRELSQWMKDRADQTMRDLIDTFGEEELFGEGRNAIWEYLVFTAIFMVRIGNFAHVISMGDGYILDYYLNEAEPRVLELTPKIENTPLYPIYRFMPIPEDVRLRNNWANDDFEWVVNEVELAPDEYMGIATDGLRYAIEESPKFPKWESQEFAKLLCARKRGPLARLINRHRENFADDITLIW